MKKIIALLLVTATLLSLLTVGVSAKSIYRLDGLSEDYSALMQAEDDEMILGSISAKYESNGDPGRISDPDVDPIGGVSYGAYMFAGNFGVPIAFANWCKDLPGNAKANGIGEDLLNAYAQDGSKYGDNFNEAWRNIAAADSQGFLLLQHDFVKANFYDVMVKKLTEAYPNDFNIDNYTMAFKNVIWSRAVQHGTNSSVFFNAIRILGGKWKDHTEEELIRAVYAESACVITEKKLTASYVTIKEEDAKKLTNPAVNVSLLKGNYLSYFPTQPSNIQASVFRRLTILEPADVFEMYTRYTGKTVEQKYVSPNIGDEKTNVDPRGSGSYDDPGEGGSMISFFITVVKVLFEAFKMMSDFFVTVINLIASWIKSMK